MHFNNPLPDFNTVTSVQGRCFPIISYFSIDVLVLKEVAYNSNHQAPRFMQLRKSWACYCSFCTNKLPFALLKILYSCLCSAFILPEDNAWLFQVWPLLESNSGQWVHVYMILHPNVMSVITLSSRMITRFPGIWHTPLQQYIMVEANNECLCI